MPQKTVGIPLVGRETELADLVSALENAISGQGGLTMLVGEPGIGKTRLQEELESIAKSRRVQVGKGECLEGGSTPPFWPWIQIIRSLVANPSQEIQSALASRASVIGELVPEMSIEQQPSTTELDSVQSRFRLFESITSLLYEISEHTPLMIVLDDLHWADKASLELLEFTAREISGKSFLIVGGYRDTELSRRHPLSESLAVMARIRGFQRIPLRGLGSTEVAQLVTSVGAITPPVAVVNDIHSRTEGNPFFVSEISRDMAREIGNSGEDKFDFDNFRIPEGVREAIGIRLNRLSEECNEVLQTAAVIGRTFDFSLLAALNNQMTEESLLILVEQAIAANMVSDISDQTERYEFTHALIQEVLASEITTRRRVRLHARVIEAIEDLYPDQLEEHAVELVHHCSEAEAVVGEDNVIRYGIMAGEAASTAYSWIDARTYFGQALEALSDLDQRPERAIILAGLGKAELFSLTYPDIQRGWDHVAEAFDLYVEHGDTDAALALTSQASGFLRVWVSGTANVYSRALEMVTPGTAEEANLLEKYAIGIALDEQDIERSNQVLQQALDIASKTGDQNVECRVLNSLCGIQVAEGNFRDAIDLGIRALLLARETNQPIEEFGCLDKLSSASISVGDTESAFEYLDAAEQLEQRFGIRAAIDWLRYLHTLLLGQLDKASELSESLDQDHIDDSVTRLFVGIGAWHIDERPDMAGRIHAAQIESQSAPTVRQQIANIVLLALAAHIMDIKDDSIRAADLARQIFKDENMPPGVSKPLRVAMGLSAVVTNNATEALESYNHLKSWSGAMIATAGPMPGDRLLGLLASVAGMTTEADEHFEDAIEFCRKSNYRLEATWTNHDYANALMARANSSSVSVDSERYTERAKSLIADGLIIAREIGSSPLENRLLRLQQKSASISAPAPAFPDALTSREVDVLRLLAAGNSNQQIADELVIALNTVRTHVANILGKTRSSNRTEAAVYAAQKGLSGP